MIDEIVYYSPQIFTVIIGISIAIGVALLGYTAQSKRNKYSIRRKP